MHCNWLNLWHFRRFLQGELLLGNYDVGNCFFLFHHLPVIFFLFVEAAKEWRMERKKTRISFYSWGLRLFSIEDCFPERVEITVVTIQGISGISWIIFLPIVDLHVCLCSVSNYNWCWYEQEAQHAVKTRDLNKCVYSYRQPIVCFYSHTRCIKGTEKEFPFGIRKPLFLGMHWFCILSEASWEIVIVVVIYLFYLVFISFFSCYCLFFYISYLIPTKLELLNRQSEDDFCHHLTFLEVLGCQNMSFSLRYFDIKY